MTGAEVPVDVTTIGRVSLLRIRSQIIDDADVPPIREAVDRLLAAGCATLIFDVSDVEYFRSTMLGILLLAARRLRLEHVPRPAGAETLQAIRQLVAEPPGSAIAIGPSWGHRVCEIHPTWADALNAATDAHALDGWVVLCGVRPNLVEIFLFCGA